MKRRATFHKQLVKVNVTTSFWIPIGAKSLLLFEVTVREVSTEGAWFEASLLGQNCYIIVVAKVYNPFLPSSST